VQLMSGWGTRRPAARVQPDSDELSRAIAAYGFSDGRPSVRSDLVRAAVASGLAARG
jgi:hypothetical protein